MEALFKNKTKLSEENYLNLVQFHQKKNNWKYRLYTIIVSILFIVIISFQISNHSFLQAIFLFVFFIGFILYRFISPYYKTYKELHSDKIKNTLINYYFFYDKYFKVKNKLGNSKIRYYKLYKVYENKNYFYLYLNKSTAFIVDKSCFTIGTSKDFQSFIKSKVWIKFHCIS